MHPVHDVDVVLLLATALASKRRPADLLEIMVAVDLIRSGISFEAKLEDAFSRLATHGLLHQVDARYALTPAAQKIVAGLRRKADTAERIFSVKEALSAHESGDGHAPIHLSAEQITAALVAHQAAAKSIGKSVLIPNARKAEFIEQHQAKSRRPPRAPRRKG